MDPVHASLVDGRAPRRVQIVNAVGLEGNRVIAEWRADGERRAQQLSEEHVVVPVRTRAEADSAEVAGILAGAGLVTIHAQTSENLIRTIRGTALWSAVLSALRDGASVCASGVAAMALGGVVPDVRPQDRLLGLGLVPGLALLPDVDGLGSSIPHAVLAPLAEADEDVTVVGLDTDTALVGSGPADDGRWEFRALGRGSAWVIAPERRRRVLAPLRLAVRA